jgi:hypothetical protein
MSGLVDLEADHADALPDGLCPAEEAGGFVVTAVLEGETGEALEDIGDEQVRPEIGGACQRMVGVPFGLVGLTQRDRHAGCGGRAIHR